MKLSIIIPVYNVGDFLRDCLDSCLRQSPYIIGQDYEIVLVNDGSTDNSLEIINSYVKKYQTGG